LSVGDVGDVGVPFGIVGWTVGGRGRSLPTGSTVLNDGGPENPEPGGSFVLVG
jgi:hypothetical protein